MKNIHWQKSSICKYFNISLLHLKREVWVLLWNVNDLTISAVVRVEVTFKDPDIPGTLQSKQDLWHPFGDKDGQSDSRNSVDGGRTLRQKLRIPRQRSPWAQFKYESMNSVQKLEDWAAYQGGFSIN